MKYLIFLGILFGLYFFGTILGPHITPVLVSEAKTSDKLKKDISLGRGLKYEVNLAEMRDAELPAQVKMLIPVEISLVGEEGKKVLAKGDSVTLKNRNGDLLIIESLDQLAKGEVDIAATDIFKVIAEAKLDERLAEMMASAPNTPVLVKPAVSKTVTPAKPEMKEEPMVEKEPMVKEEPKMAEKMADKPVEETPPAPTTPTTLTPEEIIEAMKASINAGDLKEFNFAQVKAWKAGDDEEIDGEKYQIGLAIYAAETIFGSKDVEVKALFKGGKLEKWIYTNTGMKIR